mgnify:CR=1 FL=1
MKKRLLSLLLCLCTLLSLMTVSASAAGFRDVPAGKYYATPVNWAVSQGITNGKTATTFAPDEKCTRAQILTFLWRAAGSPEISGVANPFVDVEESAYYYHAALWAREKGFVSGTKFAPNTLCTRAATVEYFWKYAGCQTVKNVPFSDVNASGELAKAVSWAVRYGVTNGTSTTTFSPKETCTRGQIVTFLHRYFVEPLIYTEPANPAPSQPSSSSASVVELLNRAPLTPMRTNDAVLDTMVTGILNQIITENMSTYEKVRACYDYLKKNTVYGDQGGATLVFGTVYESREDYKLVTLSREILSTGIGVCDHYAAAFQVLTRRLGLESYICTGKYGSGAHVWNVITLEGEDYIFDAQIDDLGSGSYNHFGKTFGEVGSKYSNYNVAQNKSDFQSFRRVAPPGYYPDLATYLPQYLSATAQGQKNLEQATDYSNAISSEATLLRAEMGLPPLQTEAGAVRAANFCALAAALGEEVTTEIAAYTLLAEGAQFQYVVLVPLGECDDPVQLVHDELEAFTNYNFHGIAAGVCHGQWTLLFYGG